jgi:CDP-2,3-bis-(O-geranylgeranyl)-sn-glycerol synthase
MLPAYIPNPVAALFGGGLPIDLRKNYSDGRRLFGDGKTYRGLVAGILAGIIIGLIQMYLQGIFSLAYLPQQTYLSISLLAIGALLGDLCKSFFKRRLGKDRGSKWPVADQYDLVIGAFVLLLIVDPSWLFSQVTLAAFVVILVLTPILHRATNIIGYLIKVKEVPW